jgi:hemin uptake protein HemP
VFRPGEPRNGKSVTENEAKKRESLKNTEKQPVRVLRSADLLANGREVVIDHGGEHYLLRCTSNGKLILTK